MDISDLPFVPENELENKLVEAQDERISESDFSSFIFEQTLYFPSLTQPGPDLSGFRGAKYKNKGMPTVAAYTSLSKLNEVIAKYGSSSAGLALAKYCLEIGVKDMIFRMPPKLGIIVNPEYEYRFLWDSKAIKKIKKILARRGDVPSKENVNAREIEL